MANPKYQLTAAIRAQLEWLSKDEISMNAAASELGIHRDTLIKAAQRAGIEDWLRGLFPIRRKAPVRTTSDALTRKRAHEPTQTLARRASTLSWRPANHSNREQASQS